MRFWALLTALLALAACGVDSPPVPPGQTIDDTISDPSEIRPENFTG